MKLHKATMDEWRKFAESMTPSEALSFFCRGRDYGIPFGALGMEPDGTVWMLESVELDDVMYQC